MCFRTRAHRAFALSALAVLVACQEHSADPVGLEPIRGAEILDASHSASFAGFHFLRPIAEREPSITSDLNAALLPHLSVEICRLENGACAEVIRTFTAEDEKSERLRLENDEVAHFHVNWHTGRYGARAGDYYRITVTAAGQPLGHADAVIGNNSQLKGVDRSEYVPVRAGSTLPIRFHVDDGVHVIGPAGGTSSFLGGAVTLEIGEGVLEESVAITVEPLADAPEEAGIFVLGGSAYDFGPDGFSFDAPVQLTIAYDEADLPAGREEHELVLLHFEDGSWQAVTGSTVDTDANTVSAPVTSFSPYAPGGGKLLELSAFGSATLDGILSSSEWPATGCASFSANLPGGRTTPAELCIMNDGISLQVGLELSAPSTITEVGFVMTFDNTHDGFNAGDDVLASVCRPQLLNCASSGAFSDDFLVINPANGVLTNDSDILYGGSNDVLGTFYQAFGVIAFEMSHPLQSGDPTHDFVAAPGDTIGFSVVLFLESDLSGVVTFFPWPDHGHITIKAGPDQQQPILDTSVGNLGIGGNSEQMLAQVVTAGISGKLAEVKFPVACGGGNLLVEIQGVTNGQPNGAVLASQSVPAADLPSFFPDLASFPRIAFANPAVLNAGQQFAIVLKNTTAGESCGMIPGPVGNPYAGGDGFFDSRPNQAGVWVLLSPRTDLPFQTFMQ